LSKRKQKTYEPFLLHALNLNLSKCTMIIMSTETDDQEVPHFHPYCDDTGESLLHLLVRLEIVADESEVD